MSCIGFMLRHSGANQTGDVALSSWQCHLVRMHAEGLGTLRLGQLVGCSMRPAAKHRTVDLLHGQVFSGSLLQSKGLGPDGKV